MDGWEKAKTLSSIASAVIIPAVLLVVGNGFSGAIKERELQGKFVELAVSILRETPSDETRNLREWATQVINQYSGVPLSVQTKKDLIENTPLPLAATPYDAGTPRGRMLGNSEPGDGVRFIGRGYVQITGRANYTRVGNALGIDLVAQPEKAEEPETAAKILVEFFLERKNRLLPLAESGDYLRVRRFINGGSQGAQAIAERTAVYQKYIERHAGPAGAIPGVINPAWTAVHVPAILKALDAREVTSVPLRAYILASAEYDSKEGTMMKEIPQPPAEAP